jgi:hypothetical protein
MVKTEIDKDEPLYPGDKIEMHFTYLGPNWVYLHAAELALLEWTLKQKNPYWEMLSWQSLEDKLILEFLIKEPPAELEVPVQKASFVTAAIIAAIVLGAGLFTWLSLDKIYKITESPAGQVALAGTGSIGIVILVIAVLLLIRK